MNQAEPREADILTLASRGEVLAHAPEHRGVLRDYILEAIGRCLEFDHKDRAAKYEIALKKLEAMP